MSEYVHKSHNVTVLMYHLVFPAKYRRAVIDAEVDEILKETCLEIEKRYQMKFLEIGTDLDHVHFLVQSVPTYSAKSPSAYRWHVKKAACRWYGNRICPVPGRRMPSAGTRRECPRK